MNFAAIKPSWEGPAQCEYCQIRDIALFSSLCDEDFNLIHEPICEQKYAKGETLYRANTPGRNLFTVREGVVKLVDYSASSGERIVRLLRRGDVAGLEALVNQPYQHNAVAINATLTCSIPITVINELSERVPEFYRHLLGRWQRAVNEADRWLTELGMGPVKTRLARLLIHLAEEDSSSICFIPSREEIGAMMGVTTETVSRAAAEFNREGLVTNIGVNRIKVNVEDLRLFVE